ncbi:MAG: kynureninase [Bdellovibrionaceae bacterium]|nr:kynureninase [Pseudobdellovibrionaceae bacterium]
MNSNSLTWARSQDENDTLWRFRDQFVFPQADNRDVLYFAGHSLGLMPKRTPQMIQAELDAWGQYGVEGHFKSSTPWVSYHEAVTASLARLVGAKESEVVAMNSLTVNLHMMMTSFYRPSGQRCKILIEANTFPSDKYAVDSQARLHGLNPRDTIVELKHAPGADSIDEDFIISEIKRLGNSLSLVLIGQCNYLSGQKFNMQKIAEAAHAVGANVGFNLAHGAGNLAMNLHEDDVDFAVWCSYKYLNSGAGGIAGCFVHEKHHAAAKNPAAFKTMPRFEGWWGHNKTERFKMGPDFDPIQTVEAWQLSNPPIFQLAALRASLQLFDEMGIANARKRGDQLTHYFETQIKENIAEHVTVVTPASRGSMLCLKVNDRHQDFKNFLIQHHAIVDFREPNIIRATPTAMYNSYTDIFNLVHLMKRFFHG